MRYGYAPALLMMAAVRSGARPALTGAQEPEGPAPNSSTEPLAREFSLERGRDFLDTVSVLWQKKRKCLTCHTNVAYLSTGAGYASKRPAFAEQTVSVRWEEPKGPRYPADVVIAAQGLAISDAETTGKLHARTRKALDRMWTVQRADGGWEWGEVRLGAAGVRRPLRRGGGDAGSRGLRRDARGPGGPEEGPRLPGEDSAGGAPPPGHAALGVEVRAGHHERGGPGVDRERASGAAAARREGLRTWRPVTAMGRASSSSRRGSGGCRRPTRVCSKGIAWLKTHQRESGRWFTRSLSTDSKHYLTHAGTAFALLALHECGEKGSEEKSR